MSIHSTFVCISGYFLRIDVQKWNFLNTLGKYWQMFAWKGFTKLLPALCRELFISPQPHQHRMSPPCQSLLIGCEPERLRQVRNCTNMVLRWLRLLSLRSHGWHGRWECWEITALLPAPCNPPPLLQAEGREWNPLSRWMFLPSSCPSHIWTEYKSPGFLFLSPQKVLKCQFQINPLFAFCFSISSQIQTLYWHFPIVSKWVLISSASLRHSVGPLLMSCLDWGRQFTQYVRRPCGQ